MATRYDVAQRALAPASAVLTAITVSHPAATVRLVDDDVDRVIDGERHIACRFRARMMDDPDGQAPQAAIEVDNVGRALTDWIDATEGAKGATLTVAEIVAGDPSPAWSLTVGVRSIHIDQRVVRVVLGHDHLLGRSAVLWRHDAEHTPGIY